MDVFDLVAKITLDKSEYDNGLDEASKSSSSFGSKLGTAAKVGAAALATVGTAAVAAGGAVLSQAGNVATYGDNIDKMSQKMGMSASAYQEWDAVMQHSGTSMETMKSGMKTLANAVENGNEAFERIGLTQEEIASMSQEELFGATIKGLQNVDDETERTYLAGQLLGRGATELGALLNTSAEETQAMRDRVRELGGVMSDDAVKASARYQDSLQDMTTAISGLRNGIVGEFLPSISDVMDGITKIFAGEEGGGALIQQGIEGILTNLNEAIPRFMETGGQIISALGNALLNNLPMIFTTGASIVENLVMSLLNALPRMVEVALNIITTLAQGLGDSLPTMVPQIVQVITQIVTTLTDPNTLSALLTAALAIITGLAQGIIQSIPTLVASLPQIITNLVNFFVTAGPQIAKAGYDLLVSLIKNIPGVIKTVAAAIPQIITSIVTAIGNGVANIATAGYNLLMHMGDKFGQVGTWIGKYVKGIPSAMIKGLNETVNWFKNIGSNLIAGLWGGFVEKWNSLKDTITDWGNNVVGFFKSVFGVASPSKVFAEIGGFLDEGLVKGLVEGKGDVLDTAKDMSKEIADGMQIPEITPVFGSGSLSSTYRTNSAGNGSRTVILQVDRTQLGKVVFDTYNTESKRVGVNLAGGMA